MTGGLAVKPVQVLRYSLAAGPLPSIIRTLEVAELARRAVLARYGGEEKRPAPPVLSGHADAGPWQSQHQHAFYLPVDEDEDGLIDHLVVYSPAGFEPDALTALVSIRGLDSGDGYPGWPLRLEGMHPAETLQADGAVWAPAGAWESVTPFLLTRYPKQHRDGTPKLTERGEQRDGPEDQVRREWVLRQEADPTLPVLVEVVPVPSRVIRGRDLWWRQFQTARRRGEGRGCRFAYGLRLRFAAPVAGPIGLGYGCHFGMGQFRPTRG